MGSDRAPPPAVLTADTAASYVSSRSSEIGVFPPSAALSAEPIAGGNVNFAFRVSSADGKEVFVKQAPEYVAIFGPDGLPLTSARIEREVAVMGEWAAILGDDAKRFLPALHHFDGENKVFVMEFLGGYELLDHRLVGDPAPSAERSIAKSMGEFMALTHLATHSSKVTAERAASLTKDYENRALRDIQLEYVFTKAYNETSAHSIEGFDVDGAFLKEVAALKARYNGEGGGDNLALCHGDLHPGSVMVRASNADGDGGGADVRVIDPEFTVYGPPGLDVGSLLSGYVLAAVHQRYAPGNGAAERALKVSAVAEGALACWEAYRAVSSAGGMSETHLKETEAEAVGYAVAEVCRTALGFAGGRLWLQFDDPAVKEEAVQAALAIVRKCMAARHEIGMAALEEALGALL